MSELTSIRSGWIDLTAIGTHLAPALGYGGIAESFYNLLRAWARDGRRIRVCVSDASKGSRLKPGVIGLPKSVSVELYHALWFKRFGFGLGAISSIFFACARARVTYVCGVGTWPLTLGVVYCALLRRPFAVATRGGLMSAHVAEIRKTKPYKWAYYRLILLPALRRARFIHVTSELERRGVLELLPLSRCVLVPNGIDLAEWQVEPRTRKANFTLCFVGRTEPDKGINRFARLFLAVRRPGDRLLIVGDNSGKYLEYTNDMRTIIERSAGAIEHLGYLDRAGVRSVLARSDFLVLPSGIEGNNERENFGNSVAEALASGRPVLATHGLAWDFIDECGIGFTFDRTDASIMATIDRARSVSSDAYEAMCHTARAYADANLRIDATAERLWDALQSIADEKLPAELLT